MINTRLLKVFKANVLGQVVLAIIQIASVPLFLNFWGSSYYGEWLILSTLPSYLSISDLGFTAVITNETTMLIGKEKSKQANYLFRQTWGGLLLLSMFLLGLVVLVLTFFDVHSKQIVLISNSSAIVIILLLTLGTLINLQAGLFQGLYRTFRCQHIALNFSNFFKACEFLGIAFIVYANGKALDIAFYICLIRMIGFIVVYLDLKYRFSALVLVPILKRYNLLTPLIKPALYYALIPLGQGLIFQGSTAIVGLKLGTQAVVGFTATRTITSTIRQLLNLINNSVWNEFSILFGENRLVALRKMYKKTLIVALCLSTILLLFFTFTGELIMKLWTSGKIVIEQPFFFLMLSVIVFDSLWHTSQVLLSSINKHESFAKIFVFGSVLSSLFCFFSIESLGLTSVPLGFIILAIILAINSYFSVRKLFVSIT